MVIALNRKPTGNSKAATAQPDDAGLPPAPDFSVLVAAESAYKAAVAQSVAFAERRRAAIARLNGWERRTLDATLTPEQAAEASREYSAARAALDQINGEASDVVGGDAVRELRGKFTRLFDATAEVWRKHTLAHYARLLGELHRALVAGWEPGASPRAVVDILQETHALVQNAEDTRDRWTRRQENDDPQLTWPGLGLARPEVPLYYRLVRPGGETTGYEYARRHAADMGWFRLPVDDERDRAELERQARHKRQVELDRARIAAIPMDGW